jgi:hypothetical protein
LRGAFFGKITIYRPKPIFMNESTYSIKQIAAGRGDPQSARQIVFGLLAFLTLCLPIPEWSRTKLICFAIVDKRFLFRIDRQLAFQDPRDCSSVTRDMRFAHNILVRYRSTTRTHAFKEIAGMFMDIETSRPFYGIGNLPL